MKDFPSFLHVLAAFLLLLPLCITACDTDNVPVSTDGDYIEHADVDPDNNHEHPLDGDEDAEPYPEGESEDVPSDGDSSDPEADSLETAESDVEAVSVPDMLTPAYYNSDASDAFRLAVDAFVATAREDAFHHPLQNIAGITPSYSIPDGGIFGAGKGPNGTAQHHPAIDMHVGNRETAVTIHAAHGGMARSYRDAPKYRHYISVTKDLENTEGMVIGSMVTIYAHVDLDLDEAAGLFVDGTRVQAGDELSRNLYADTVGGPHLHFEIRFYRPTDNGDETFYSFVGPEGSEEFTAASAGPWSWGFWNPLVGYGFGNPANHGLLQP